jgi:hypothetical protein
MFFKGSRYATVPTATLVDETGRVVTYKTTRFIPDTPAVVGHRVVGGERLDHVAWQHYRDPERFWRICDANRALWPADLLEIGRVILVPPSEG